MADDTAVASSAAPTTGATASPSVPSTPAPAIEGQGTPAAAADATAAPGPIPYDRHKAILDGAYGERDNARREFEQFKQQYGWAAHVDPSEFQQIQRWSQAYRSDPVRWMAETIGELRQQFPHLTPALTSEAARILAGSRGFQPEPDIEPDIPVVGENGQVVGQAFSADKVKALIQRAVAEAVTPVKQTLAQREAAEQALAMRHEAQQAADTLFERAQKWHGFNDHKPAILQAMEQNPAWSLHDAYLHVLHTEILPKASQKSQTELLTHLQTQAAGATAHPGQVVPTAKPKFKSFSEAMAYYDKHPEERDAMATR